MIEGQICFCSSAVLCLSFLWQMTKVCVISCFSQSWLHTCSTCTCVIATWAQLFEGRLALNVRLNLTEVSFSCVQKHFLGQFSLLFLQLPIINLYTKRITCKAEMLLKASYLNSNLALTLGYLNPALNNSALEIRIVGSSCCPQLHVP